MKGFVPIRALTNRTDFRVFRDVLRYPDMIATGTGIFPNTNFTFRTHNRIVYQLVDNSLITPYTVPQRTEYVTTHKGEDMKLLTKELVGKLPPLRGQDDQGDNAIAYAKFFDPTGSWTWYATEYDPAERMFFGLVRGFEDELGYFSLDELESIRGAWGLGIERDIYFTPTTLNDIKGGE